MTRAEHLAWAKERALQYVDASDPNQALASFTSDLRGHPDLIDHAAIELGFMLAMAGHLSTARDVRHHIEGTS